MLSDGASWEKGSEIRLSLRTSTAPPLTIIDLPGLNQEFVEDLMIAEYAQLNDAILLVIVPASEASEISSSLALKIANEYDPERTRTVGIIGAIDQAAENLDALANVEALLSDKGPPELTGIPWVALICQLAQSGSGENSLQTACRAEIQSLMSCLGGAPQSKLGRIALVNTLSSLISGRVKLRLPNLLQRHQGKFESEGEKLQAIVEQLANTGKSAIELDIIREYVELSMDQPQRNHLTRPADIDNAEELLGFDLFKNRNSAGVVLVAGDIVKKRESGLVGVVFNTGEGLLSLSEPKDVPVGIDDILLVRIFRIGDIVRRIERDRVLVECEKGTVTFIERTVGLLGGNDACYIEDVSIEEIQPMRGFACGDWVCKGTWLGSVTSVTRFITFVYVVKGVEVEFSELNPDPTEFTPIFTNSLEEWRDEPFYKGQSVRIVSRGVSAKVKSHRTDSVHVQWFGEGKGNQPPQVLLTSEVELVQPPRFRAVAFSLGQRCLFKGEEYLITECKPSTIRVAWEYRGTRDQDSKRLQKVVGPLYEGFKNGDIVHRRQERRNKPYFGVVGDKCDYGDFEVFWSDGTRSEAVRPGNLVLAKLTWTDD
ncbi:uncharacterized protein LOC112081845 [Eutrema salsugineum]|uniref:uncharacterized protein LOC112081845 n=1 Tax=Eutrema salsugineum TaxID=72664 RepID=UPI000CED33DE|nr:uncharacterized protein LOC112081845 [Eutrema salsugineum]